MSGAADLIVTGRIYTVDRTRPWAEAMAVRDGRILAVGTADGLAAFRGSFVPGSMYAGWVQPRTSTSTSRPSSTSSAIRGRACGFLIRK